MIKSFRNKELAGLWATGRSRIDARMHARVLIRLSRLEVAATAEEMSLPGFDFHRLRGLKPPRYSVHINGPWCLTFEFRDGDAHRVDLEQYH